MKSFKSTAWLLPQPVLIIGTYDKEGKPNAMNAAWGGQWDMNEIVISLGSHQTTDNLAVNPEFTVAFATAETMIASDYVGIVSGRNTPDKMEKTGWSIEKAPNVNAPIFKEFPMTLECRVKQKIDESETGYYLVAEIVNILCDEKYLAEDGKPDVADTKAMNNLGVCYERGTGVKVSLEPLRVYRTKRNQSFSGSFSRYFRFPFCLTHHCPYFFPRILANEESGCALAYSSNEMLFLRASSISASRFASAAARSAAMAFCSAAFSAVEPFVFPLAFARSSRSLAASLSYW